MTHISKRWQLFMQRKYLSLYKNLKGERVLMLISQVVSIRGQRKNLIKILQLGRQCLLSLKREAGNFSYAKHKIQLRK
jgi:hypothetical protein